MNQVERKTIYEALDIERVVVIDPACGEWAGNLAWREINRLLDALNEIQALDIEVDLPLA